MLLSVEALNVDSSAVVESWVVKLLAVEISVVEFWDARSEVLLVSFVKSSDVELSVDRLSVVTLCDVGEFSVVELSVVLRLLVLVWMVVLVCVMAFLNFFVFPNCFVFSEDVSWSFFLAHLNKSLAEMSLDSGLIKLTFE